MHVTKNNWFREWLWKVKMKVFLADSAWTIVGWWKGEEKDDWSCWQASKGSTRQWMFLLWKGVSLFSLRIFSPSLFPNPSWYHCYYSLDLWIRRGVKRLFRSLVYKVKFTREVIFETVYLQQHIKKKSTRKRKVRQNMHVPPTFLKFFLSLPLLFSDVHPLWLNPSSLLVRNRLPGAYSSIEIICMSSLLPFLQPHSSYDNLSYTILFHALFSVLHHSGHLPPPDVQVKVHIRLAHNVFVEKCVKINTVE